MVHPQKNVPNHYPQHLSFNRSSRRKRGMSSNPLFIIPDFFFIFPMNFAMTTLGLKKMRKFLWEGSEKSLPSWLSQFNLLNWDRPFSLTSQSYFGKCKEKPSIPFLGGRYASFPQKPAVEKSLIFYYLAIFYSNF